LAVRRWRFDVLPTMLWTTLRSWRLV